MNIERENSPEFQENITKDKTTIAADKQLQMAPSTEQSTSSKDVLNYPKNIYVASESRLGYDIAERSRLSSDPELKHSIETHKTDKDDIPPPIKCSPSKSQTSEQLEEPGFVKLSTAEKRRFKKALSEGRSRQEALEFAKRSMDNKSATKRSHAEEGVEPAEKRKRSESSSVSTINMGLIPLDLFANPFGKSEMDNLQESIIDAAIETSSEIKPEFEGCFPRKGWLMVSCTNRNTADWLINNADVIRNKSHLELTVIEETDFPRSYYVHGTFPDSQGLPNEKILGTIEAQNQLKASTWKVLQRKWSEGSAVELSFAVDSNSYSKLRDCKGRIAYRFGHIRLILKQTFERSKGMEASKATFSRSSKHTGEEKCYTPSAACGSHTSRQTWLQNPMETSNYSRETTRSGSFFPYHGQDQSQEPVGPLYTGQEAFASSSSYGRQNQQQTITAGAPPAFNPFSERMSTNRPQPSPVLPFNPALPWRGDSKFGFTTKPHTSTSTPIIRYPKQKSRGDSPPGPSGYHR